MRSRNMKLFSLMIVIVALAPAGCRSRKAVEPTLPVPEPTRTEVVETPQRDFVPEPSREETIDWSNLDELNRLARERGWLKDAFFDYDSSGLSDSARAALRDSAQWLRDNPKARLVIEGHCDERGTEQYNLALGERRAHAATDYLAGLGVDRGRLALISYGKERPFVKGASESSHAENRRAHLKITAMN